MKWERRLVSICLIIRYDLKRVIYWYSLDKDYIWNYIELKGMHLNHDFYVVVGKQYRTENA